MIVADTSVWIGHLRTPWDVFADLLDRHEIAMHAWVIGELALGHIAQRRERLEAWGDMVRAKIAEDAEVMALIERNALKGRGIGWVDAHLLASCALSDYRLLTHDKRLAEAARQLGLAASPIH